MKHEYRGRGKAWGRKANGLKQCNGEGPTLRGEVSHLGVVYVHIHLHIWENGLAPPPQLIRPNLFLSSQVHHIFSLNTTTSLYGGEENIFN